MATLLLFVAMPLSAIGVQFIFDGEGGGFLILAVAWVLTVPAARRMR